MRSLAVLSLALVVGCSEQELDTLAAENVERAWTGSFESLDGCVDGEVSLAVAEVEPGWFEGTYRYVSGGELPDYVAIYDVQGALDAGVLVLDQVDAHHADWLPDPYGWCFGELELGLDGKALGGAWTPSNCDCTGSVEMTPS